MDNFRGKIAVVTGGGTGMGRELCLQLVKEGCAVATCDVIMENLEETHRLCQKAAPDIKVTLHQCDVSSEEQMLRFREEVKAAHGAALNLLFNNAGVGGGASMTSEEDRDVWERTFNICWYGVYFGVRAFMPMLMEADEGRIVNTSSVNGFWATVGQQVPHTAYASAKFAVKGFSEALINDLRTNAPHLGVSVVMPGHIGTGIAANASKVLRGYDTLDMSEQEIRGVRERLMKSGGPLSELIMNLSDDQIREVMHQRGIDFEQNAPTTAADAATIILDGVKAGKWRILVGEDAHVLDEMVRARPEMAYEKSFTDELTAQGHFGGLIQAVGDEPAD